MKKETKKEMKNGIELASIDLETLAQELQTEPVQELTALLREHLNLAGEIKSKYRFTLNKYRAIDSFIKNFEPDAAYKEVMLTHRNLDRFFREKIYDSEKNGSTKESNNPKSANFPKVERYRPSLLSSEVRGQLFLLEHARNALLDKIALCKEFIENLQVLVPVHKEGQITFQEEINDAVPLYFQRFCAFDKEDPLEEALVILKQRNLYLPEVRLVAHLHTELIIPQKGDTHSAFTSLLPGMSKRISEADADPDFPVFEANENYYYMTGTFCSRGKNIKLVSYLKQHSNKRMNTVHAPSSLFHRVSLREEKRINLKHLEKNRADDTEIFEGKSTPFIPSAQLGLWMMPFRGVKQEKKLLYQALTGQDLDSYHDLKHRLGQGMIVIRSSYDRWKLNYDVATQDPKNIQARLFYGATPDKENMVQHMRSRMQEIDKEHGVEFPD